MLKSVPVARDLYLLVGAVLVAPARKFAFRVRRRGHHRQVHYADSLSTALVGGKAVSDISDHLGAIFFFATNARPKLIVELGTRGGESTRALLASAQITGATLLSIDISGPPHTVPDLEHRWRFVKTDDVRFAKNSFRDWCASESLAPSVDVLFVDTSHEYEHTKQELEAWVEHLSSRAILIFHDTNMGNGVYRRTDGSVALGWNNQRGVIRAIEELLGRRYDENAYFCDFARGYVVMHFPHCNGLTVLQRHG